MIAWLGALLDEMLSLRLPGAGERIYSYARYASVPGDDPNTMGVGSRHLDGVPWWQTTIPPAHHVCWVQSMSWVRFERVQRCACGGIRPGATYCWTERNSRRKVQDAQGH